MLKPTPAALFTMVNDLINGLLAFTTEGSRFSWELVTNNVPVGSPLGDPPMGPIIERTRPVGQAWVPILRSACCRP